MSTPQLSKSQKTKLKIFQQSASRVKALISFKKITTYKEAIEELAIPPSFIEGSALEDKVTPQDFALLLKALEPKLLESWVKVTKAEPIHEENKETFWNVADVLIESTEYLGHLEEKKTAHKQKLEFLESFLPPKNPHQKGSCLYFQYETALEMFHAIKEKDMPAILLRANTGDGKTFCAGQLIRWILDSKMLDTLSITPWKILYITGASITEQSTEDLEEHFGITVNPSNEHPNQEVMVVNYESLRSNFGLQRFLEKKIIVEQGEEHEVWEWRKLIHPALIIWDECHKLKNEDSIQSKIAQATNNLEYIFPLTQKPAKVYQVFMSASPFSRVVHAKAFAVATRHEVAMGAGKKRIANRNWTDIAKKVCSPAHPDEYSKQAIKRFLREFKPYIFTFKNVRRKHKGILETTILDFLNANDKKKYQEAWDTFLERKRQLEGMEYGNSKFLLLVQLSVLRQAADLLKSYQIAKIAYDDWTQGFAPVIMCPFKPTIAKTMLHLINDFNIPRSKISVIWGGNALWAGNKEKRFITEQIKDILARAFRDPESIKPRLIKQIHTQLQSDAEGLGDIDASLRLGHQSKEQRNMERKAFQDGETEFCFATFGAGKEGLSLHQREEWLRPRRQTNATTYNEMEMLQAEGRTARITSKSDTLIRTLAYRDTIEVPVLKRVMAKRRCLNVVLSHGAKEGMMQELDGYNKDLEKVFELAGISSESEGNEDEELEEAIYDEIESEIDNDDTKE